MSALRLPAALKRAPALPWPLPALRAWGGAWAFWMAWGAGAPRALAPWLGFVLATLVGAALALGCRGTWRRAIAIVGFPLSALALGAAAIPPWAWLLLALPVLAAYPVHAWRDAPFFPTPPDALAGLDTAVGAPPRRVLDAGCGLGHGLQALRRLWPQAELHGIEWSVPLAWAARWRCRAADAAVVRGDMWAASWAGFDGVYVFQRPESMARAHAKAAAELAPGAWLASLEFAVPGRPPTACIEGPGRRPVWLYRIDGAARDSTNRPASR